MGMTTQSISGPVVGKIEQLTETKTEEYMNERHTTGVYSFKGNPVLDKILEEKSKPFNYRSPYVLTKEIRQEKWDLKYLKLAKYWGDENSKDPSRKIGAVIVDSSDFTIISMGYNGFARGVEDTDERLQNRDVKYELVVHAEQNAILTAKRDLSNATLYSILFPCSRCAGIIINSGIKKLVTIDYDKNADNITKVHFDLSEVQFKEAGVQIIRYTKTYLDEIADRENITRLA